MPISPRARELFLAQLAVHEIEAEELDDGAFKFVLGETTLTINLENKSREFDETGDEAIFAHFVETMLHYRDILPTTWAAARSRVYLTAEPSDHDFGHTCRQTVSDQVCLVLVYVSEQGDHIVWLTPDLLARLGTSREQAEAHAVDNLAHLLAQTPIRTEVLDGHPLGMFETHSVLKASLIFARNLREVAEPVLGWPLLAVIPCRDFAYVFPESARALLPGIAPIVIREYTERGYPISTEVFRITSEKVEAIGEFQSPFNPPKGMKAVDRDAMLTFFLPREWEEEEDANGEPMYFDPESEAGWLGVATQRFESKEDMREGQAHEALAPMAEDEGVEVEDWPGDRAMIHFMGEDEDNQTWTWALGGPIGPRRMGLAIFTYYEPLENADEEETQTRIAMLKEMLPRALFRDREAEAKRKKPKR